MKNFTLFNLTENVLIRNLLKIIQPFEPLPQHQNAILMVFGILHD